MAIILNIGLAREGNTNLTVQDVLDEATMCGMKFDAYRIVESDTEPTLVARLTAGSNLMNHTFSKNLEQDCIAIYADSINEGRLVGPNAAKWGEFNPEYFFLLDGSRLSDQQTFKLAA